MAHKTKAEERKAQTRTMPEEEPEFQIAPMIDILLVLLVFFMSISSTEVLQTNKEVTLSVAKDAKQPDKNQPGQVIINVTWVDINNVGGIEIDGKRYNQGAELVPVLAQALRNNQLVRVLVRADRLVKYDFLRQILQACGDASITNLTFSVVDKEAPKVAPATK